MFLQFLSQISTEDFRFNNRTKRLIKTPKLYFMDTGLCAYLTDWLNAYVLECGAMSGAILETWIISEIVKSYLHHGRHRIYFYRDKEKWEIDLFIEENGTLYPIEIKKSASNKFAPRSAPIPVARPRGISS